MNFSFPDYLPQELEQISDFAARQRAVTLSEEARSYLGQKLTEAYRKRDRSFGNARYVYSLIDEAKMNLGLRIMRSKDIQALPDHAFSSITLEEACYAFGPKLDTFWVDKGIPSKKSPKFGKKVR